MYNATNTKPVFLITLITLFLGVTGCTNPVPSMTTLSESDVILAFGDSLTYGTGVSIENSYPSILADRIGRSVLNEGIPGELSVDGLRRLPELLDEHKPALVIICHGGNDFLRKKSIDALEQNLREMIQLVKNADAEVMLVAVPQPNLLILSDAAVYQKVATEMNIPFVENTLSEILSNNDLTSDAVHPNTQGYQQMALAVESVLVDAKAL